MAEPPSNRLAELRARWEGNPGSRIYLQLADEYRKHAQTGDALEVLTKGLEHHPNDLSGLVALGRCQLELGHHTEAEGTLETVLGRDPAHIVANKLLLEVHLQRGDEARAKERLGFYRLLNDRDPELDHLVYRLERLGADDADVPAEDPAEPAVPETEASLEPVTDGSIFETSEVPTREQAIADPPASEGATTAVTADPEPATADSDRGATASIDLANAPDAEVAAPRAIREGAPFDLRSVDIEALWQAIEAGGIFRREATTSRGANGEVAVPARDEPVEEAPTVAAGAESSPSSPWQAAGLAGAGAALAGTVIAAVTADDGADEDEGEAPEALQAVPEGGAEEAASERSAADSAGDVPVTVAMGELYLEQGYPDEAETIFRQILADDPGHPAALEGLERVAEVTAAVRRGSGEWTVDDQELTADDAGDAADVPSTAEPEPVDEPLPATDHEAPLAVMDAVPDDAEAEVVAAPPVEPPDVPEVDVPEVVEPQPAAPQPAAPQPAAPQPAEIAAAVPPAAVEVSETPDEAPAAAATEEESPWAETGESTVTPSTLTAAALLESAGPIPEGLTAKKVLMLRRYVQTLKGDLGHNGP